MDIIKYGKVFYTKDIPPDYQRHIAFAGKSNVGKSTLLNKIFNRKKLAPTSSKPGKTRGLNIYIAESANIICDLPGYGYAAFSKTQREQFLRLSAEYFQQYSDKLYIFILIDIRRNLSELDISLMNYSQKYNIPYSLVLTKIDKLSNIKQIKEIERLKKHLDNQSYNIDHIFPVSSRTRKGIPELSAFLSEKLLMAS